MSNLIGQSLGPYQIVSELGHGGMSDVYLATQASMGREVALKVLSAHLLQDRSFMERFSREVQVVAKLKHPRIVPVHDFGDENGMPYIVMAYMEAGTLADRIRKDGALPLGEGVRLVAQMAEGLDYAHKRGVVHRDFKPSNVLLDGEGNTHLADFGIAKLVEDPSLLTGSGLVGTPAYMAPEMSKVGGASPLADIYSLGVTLYEMLTGERPFKGDTPVSMLMAHATEQVPNVQELRPDLPYGVQGVLARALAKDPAARYQSAGALSADLARAVQGGDVEDAATQAILSTPRPTVTPAVSGSHRRGIPALGWALGAILLAIGAAVVWRWGDISAAMSGPPPTPTEAVVAATDEGTPAPTAKSGPVLTLGHTLQSQYDTIRRIAFSPDGKTLASASADGTVVLWDVQDGTELRELGGFKGGVNGVAFAPDGPLMAASSLDMTIQIWDTRTGVALQTFTTQTGPPLGVAFSPDGSTLVTAELASNGNGTTTLWDVDSGDVLMTRVDINRCAGEASATCTGTTGDVVVSPAQPIAAISATNTNIQGYAYLWDLRTGALIGGFTRYYPCFGGQCPAPPPVSALAFDPSGSVLAVALRNGTITLWPVSGDEVVDPVTGFSSGIESTLDKSLRIPGTTYGATDLDWSPDGQWLAVATPNPLVVLLDPQTLNVVVNLEGPTDKVTSVAFSPDGTILATGLDDGMILLWRIEVAL